jgi:branched-chain amino acid transport system ATP-binding protein
MKPGRPLLEVSGICKRFGSLVVLDGVDLHVNNAEIVGLIGPNGAGKTTLFNIINGFISPTSGKITFNGSDITGLKVHQIARRGVARTFQELALCKESTVFASIFSAFHLTYKSGVCSAFLRTRSARNEERVAKEKTKEIIDFLGLGPYKDKLAGNLSSGYQKALTIAMAFATTPKLLLLDEPVTTLSEDRVDMVMNLVAKVRDAGTAVVVIEHNMKAIMNYCDRVVVLAYGKKIAEDLPQKIAENKEVIEAYLGEMG